MFRREVASEIGIYQTYFRVPIETFPLRFFILSDILLLIGFNVTWVGEFRRVSAILMDRNKGV